FFYRLHRELVAAECALALDDGGQNEMAVRFVACSCSRCMRGERKFRPGKAPQASDARATNVGTGDAGPSETDNSESIQSGCERRPSHLVADGMRERGLQDPVLSVVEKRVQTKMVHVFQGARRPTRL